MVLDLPTGPLIQNNMEVNETRSGEGECCSCGAVFIVEAMRAQACVTVFSTLQPRMAGGPILAIVVHTAIELHMAAIPSPRKFAWLCLRTVAGEGRPSIFTPTSILTGLALTFINVHFTQLTWRGTTAEG